MSPAHDRTTARAAVSGYRTLRVGTRGSPLALAQAARIARRLQERCGRAAVPVTVATPGDSSTAPIERLGTTGVFTSTLREALLRGDVDLVVHSCKDLPTAPVPGLQMAAFPAREDPRDALIWPGRTHLDTLPPGARIGTGSPRRAALLRATGRQLQIVPMRGNGVLAVECRSDDPATAAQLRTLDHAPTRAAATTERGFLAGLGAGCTVPAGALAGPAPGPGGEPAVRVSGIIAAADGSAVIRGRVTGPAGDPLGRQLARMLLQHGDAALLDRPGIKAKHQNRVMPPHQVDGETRFIGKHAIGET